MTWNGVDTQWAADIRSLTATQIGTSSGTPKARASGLAFSYTIGPKTRSPELHVFVLPTDQLPPLANC